MVARETEGEGQEEYEGEYVEGQDEEQEYVDDDGGGYGEDGEWYTADQWDSYEYDQYYADVPHSGE